MVTRYGEPRFGGEGWRRFRRANAHRWAMAEPWGAPSVCLVLRARQAAKKGSANFDAVPKILEVQIFCWQRANCRRGLRWGRRSRERRCRAGRISMSIEGEAERTSPLPMTSLLSSVPPTTAGMACRPAFV